MDQTRLQQLRERLARWEKRRRLTEMIIWVPRGVLVGLTIAAALAFLARSRPLLNNAEVGFAAGLLALIGALAGLLVVLARRRPLLEQARFADGRFGLLERTSTALEIASGLLDTSAVIADRQLADTLQATESLNERSFLPLRPVRQEVAVLVLALLLLVAAIVFPNPQADLLEEERLLDAALDEQVEELENLIESVEENPDFSAEDQEDLLAPIEGALEELAEGDPSREEAVAALSEAEAELRELSDRADGTLASSQGALLQALQEAAQSLANSEVAGSLGEALQNGDLTGARSAASQLADELPALEDSEREQLAADLAETAGELLDIDPELAAELNRAARELATGDVESAREALEQAAATLQERAQEQAASQQAAAAAEQLAQGRQELAQAGTSRPDSSGDQGQGQAGGEGQGGDSGGEGDGQGQAGGQGQITDQGEGTGGPGPGGGHAEQIFVPEFVDLANEAGVDVELPAECVANPNDCGALLSETPLEFDEEQSLVPYNQVFGDYRDAAYRALEEEYIPLSLKGYVRDYFSSLEP